MGDIVADERKVKQILLNLLSNAVKFTPEGGRVGVTATAAEGVITIAVSDTGIGIAPEDQAAVFEEFRQVGRDDARKQEGTGLGLTLAKKFVELHGGESGSRAKWARDPRLASLCPFGLKAGVRAIREEARLHGHDVSPVPARQPDSRPVLPRLRRPPHARLRRLWRRTTRGRPLLPPVRPGRRREHAATVRAPETYTPKHLAEKILISKAALEGERKQVTVLFADLKGSMELLADRDPEEARKLLDPVLEQMMEAVHRYEGTVNQVMGDGIMALFGAPWPTRIMRSGRATPRWTCSAAIGGYARTPASPGRHGPHPRGPQLRRGRGARDLERSPHGLHGRRADDPPAARMEQLASPGTTLLTADTLRLAEGYIEVRPLGAMPVKGLAAPVETYELTGAGPRRSRLSAAAARGLRVFRGRGGRQTGSAWRRSRTPTRSVSPTGQHKE